MSISRWDPWGDIISLRQAMNNLLEESFVRPRSGLMSQTSGLAVDLHESGDDYILSVSLPGVSPDDVNISILGDTLTVSGERREEWSNQPQNQENQQDQEYQQDQQNQQNQRSDQGRWLIRERRFGRFERTVTLPSAINADQASADFKNGVLTITLPKAEEAKPKSIQVRSSGSDQQSSQQVDINDQTTQSVGARTGKSK